MRVVVVFDVVDVDVVRRCSGEGRVREKFKEKSACGLVKSVCDIWDGERKKSKFRKVAWEGYFIRMEVIWNKLKWPIWLSSFQKKCPSQK